MESNNFNVDATLQMINNGAKKIVLIHYDSRHIDGLRFMEMLYKSYEIGVAEKQSDGDVLEIMLEREKT